MKSLLMVAGCILGVIGGAAPFQEPVAGIPMNWAIAGAGAVLLLMAVLSGRFAVAPKIEGGKEAVAGSPAAAGEAIARAVPEIRALLAKATAMPIEDLAKSIDQVIASCVYPVIEAQKSLIAAQGFARYAAHTGPWAAGERMLYRAWSAATDGHRPEAIASMKESALHFEEASREWAGAARTAS